MNRTVGVTLRRTLGGGVILALGFGSVSLVPRELVPVAASNTTPAMTQSLVDGTDPPHQVHPIALLTPSVAPTAPVATPAAPRVRPATARPVTASAVVSRPAAGGGGAFAYGYCTWWVAHKRYVPWRGDAAQWWWNARAFGYGEGATPRTGAIMVMGAGGSASPEGHVAYVESVNANGSFVVSEMNWWGVPGGGWGRVDYRTVTSMAGILGFIY